MLAWRVPLNNKSVFCQHFFLKRSQGAICFILEWSCRRSPKVKIDRSPVEWPCGFFQLAPLYSYFWAVEKRNRLMGSFLMIKLIWSRNWSAHTTLNRHTLWKLVHFLNWFAESCQNGQIINKFLRPTNHLFWKAFGQFYASISWKCSHALGSVVV